MNSGHDSASGDQAEVCSLSRKVLLQPLSGPLKHGFRFFRFLIPAQPTAFLAVRLSRGQLFGLTTLPFHHTTGSGFAFSPVDTCDDVL